MYMLTEGLVRKRAIFEIEFCGTKIRSPGRRCASSLRLRSFSIFFKLSSRVSIRSSLTRRNSTTWECFDCCVRYLRIVQISPVRLPHRFAELLHIQALHFHHACVFQHDVTVRLYGEGLVELGRDNESDLHYVAGV